jgi:hypothetical protein
MKSSELLPHNTVNQSLTKGITYLLAKCITGKWQGFPTLAGTSDIWVTGFIIAHLKPLVQDQPMLKVAQNFLLASKQPSKGWSYSAIVPSDADSTAWCIIALENSPTISNEALKQSKEFLWSHFQGKGVSTYQLNSGIAQFINAPNKEAIAGWTSAHPDVSAAAILADPTHKNASKIFEWLNTLQQNDGCIESYWWRSPLYTTTLMLRAMIKGKRAVPKTYAKKILQGLMNMQLDEGGFAVPLETQADSFSTALALESFVYISRFGGKDEMHKCANALIALQKTEGGWEGNFILRIPAPYVLDPKMVSAYDNPDGGGNSLIKDEGGLFATAMSCYALNVYHRFIIKNAIHPTN